PKDAEGLLRPPIESILKNPAPNIFSLIVASAIWTVTSSLESLRKIFNRIYRIKDPPFFLLTRLISILQFCAALVFMLLAVAGFGLLPKALRFITKYINIPLPRINM